MGEKSAFATKNVENMDFGFKNDEIETSSSLVKLIQFLYEYASKSNVLGIHKYLQDLG